MGASLLPLPKYIYFIFFIIHFFFSRLLQAPASEHLPDITKKFRTCHTTFDYFEGHAVSTIFQTSPYPPPPPPLQSPKSLQR